MSVLVILGDVACLAAGGAIVWFGKEKLQSIWSDANTIAENLRAKAGAIEQAARKG